MNDCIKPVIGVLLRRIGFHPDNVCCDGCDFCRTDAYHRDRLRCMITQEIILDDKQLGIMCPLKFEEETNEQS